MNGISLGVLILMLLAITVVSRIDNLEKRKLGLYVVLFGTFAIMLILISSNLELQGYMNIYNNRQVNFVSAFLKSYGFITAIALMMPLIFGIYLWWYDIVEEEPFTAIKKDIIETEEKKKVTEELNKIEGKEVMNMNVTGLKMKYLEDGYGISFEHLERIIFAKGPIAERFDLVNGKWYKI